MSSSNWRTWIIAWPLWIVGIASVAFVLFRADAFILNVVNYRAEPAKLVGGIAIWIIIALIVATTALLATLRRQLGDIVSPNTDDDRGDSAPMTLLSPVHRADLSGVPLLLPIAVALLTINGWVVNYVGVTAAIVGLVWSLDLLGGGVRPWRGGAIVDAAAPWLLVVAIIAGAIWHGNEQARLWRDFMLGYADFGFFTTDLEHCLPWNDHGSLRFIDIRMGYHCVPVFYLLAPLYAIARTPLFLMYLGPLALNLAALPFYQLARQRSQSATVGLIVGLAWLLVPSISRLPYSNTYGFQSIYLAVPWLAFAFSLAMRDKWRASYIALAVALLCEETVCGVAFGWGAFLFTMRDRRREGLMVMAVAIGYLLFTTQVIIPAFAASGRYTRIDLIGNAPIGDVLSRLSEWRVPYYLLALTAPLMPFILRQPRILIAAIPTLSLVVLLKYREYLCIKFWHQSSVLPVLFLAATLGATGAIARWRLRRRGSASARDYIESTDHMGSHGYDSDVPIPEPRRSRSVPVRRMKQTDGTASSAIFSQIPDRIIEGPDRGFGPPLAMLLGVFLFHYLLAYSPLAKALQDRQARASIAGERPAQLQHVVDYVREHFPPRQTTIVATQRLAAHFTDYRMIFPATHADANDPLRLPTIYVVDKKDVWDEVVGGDKLAAFLKQIATDGYVPILEQHDVTIYKRR